MNIRRANIQTDFDKVWEIFENVIATGDTYVFDPSTPKDNLHKHWFADYMDTFVAVDNDEILGTYIIKPNQIDLGDHIANCSYMVNPEFHGRGRENSGMAYHVGVGKVQANKISFLLFQLWNNFVADVARAHLRLQVIRGYFGRRA